MAHILPETPPQLLPPAVKKVFEGLKGLPEAYFVWHHLAPWVRNAPDFLVMNAAGCAMLVKVSLAFAAQAAPAAQLLLIDDQRAPLGKAEGELLQAFIRLLDLPDEQTIETLVVFPNIPQRQVVEGRLERGMGEPAWAGRELLQGGAGLEWESFLPARPLDALWSEKLRQRFTPEVVVPSALTVRQPVQRRLEAGLTDTLLDYNQEQAVKADLDLGDEARALTDDFRLNIINGVAGSGKTLILLYRLRLLYHLYPGKTFLVLTHNRPLIRDLEHRFCLLEGSLPQAIEWHTFNSWCYQHWPAGAKWVDPIKLPARERLVQAAWREHLQESAVTAGMLQSEIDWMKDQFLMSEAEYLAADRRGRGFRLGAEQRQKVYRAAQSYQGALERQGAMDWGDVPRRIWQHIQEGRAALPQYDMILVDEAQFFAPLWFAILQKLLSPQNGHLFLVADPTQGFLGRGASWKSLGLEARGRTSQLRRSYRTTREILQFATLFYRQRLSAEIDEDILAPDLLNMPGGAFPQLIVLPNPQDEIARVANEVEALVKQGIPKQHLLLLHSSGRGVSALIGAINQRLGRFAAKDAKTDYPGNYVRVTTLNAGTGLESPIVFLAGLRELFEAEQSLRLADDEREGLMRDNTRRIYMAATRAGQRLVFTYAGELPEVLKGLWGRA
jgi:hypothetical protein